MRIFVAGGTGVVGGRLVERLAAAGHEVTATTTSSAKVGAVEASGGRAVVVDGLDAAAVGEAVAAARPEVVVHQMSALSGTPDLRHFDRWFALTNRLRTDGLDHLLAAAEASGVRQVVAQSYTGWPNLRSGGWVKTEEDPLDPEPPAAQRQTLAAICYLEDAVGKVDGTVLRYGGLYGPGASDGLVEMVRKRRFPVVGGGAGHTSWIHADDAAAATALAIEGGVRGVFNIVDDEPAPASEWLPYLAECVGAKPPMRLPAWAGRLAAGEVAISMMTRTRGSANDRARRELGWQPRWASWRDGFLDGLEETR